MPERELEHSASTERPPEKVDNSQRAERPGLTGSSPEGGSDKSAAPKPGVETGGGFHQGERPELGAKRPEATELPGDSSNPRGETPEEIGKSGVGTMEAEPRHAEKIGHPVTTDGRQDSQPGSPKYGDPASNKSTSPERGGEGRLVGAGQEKEHFTPLRDEKDHEKAKPKEGLPRHEKDEKGNVHTITEGPNEKTDKWKEKGPDGNMHTYTDVYRDGRLAVKTDSWQERGLDGKMHPHMKTTDAHGRLVSTVDSVIKSDGVAHMVYTYYDSLGMKEGSMDVYNKKDGKGNVHAVIDWRDGDDNLTSRSDSSHGRGPGGKMHKHPTH